MADPAYDTLEGIKTYLTDLDGLERLRSDRNKAGYDRHERLHEFVVLGHWLADTCGNFGKCKFELNYKLTPSDWTFPQDGLPVIRKDSLWSVLGDENWSISSSMSSELPPSHLRCPECNKGWTLGNAHDAIQRKESIIVPLTPGMTVRERELEWKDKTDGIFRFGSDPGVRNEKFIDLSQDPTCDYVAKEGDTCSMDVWRYEHTRCQMIRKFRAEREFFVQVFNEAGLGHVVLSEIPNGYWPDAYEDMQTPWFLARLPYGNIKIGWRKQVISIDWSDTKTDLYQLFASEDVTKEKYLVHAWGKDKAVEYLKKIHAALV